MTKKDYVLIAANIADVMDWAHDADTDAITAIEAVAERVATALKADNPRFDRARFLAACGVNN